MVFFLYNVYKNTMIATITANRAAKLKTMTNTPSVTLRLKVIGPTSEEIHVIMHNPFYEPQEDSKQISKKVGRAFKKSAKALGEVMSQIGEAAGQPALAELGEHTKQESRRLNKKKNEGPYTVMKSALKM